MVSVHGRRARLRVAKPTFLDTASCVSCFFLVFQKNKLHKCVCVRIPKSHPLCHTLSNDVSRGRVYAIDIDVVCTSSH